MKYNHLIYALSIGLFPNLLQTESTNFNDLHILAQALEPINKNLEHNKNMILSDTYIPLYILDENGNSLSESPSYYLSTEEMLPNMCMHTNNVISISITLGRRASGPSFRISR